MSKVFYQGLNKTALWPDIPQAMSLTYDDVNLLMHNSTVESRSAVDLGVDLAEYHLTMPVLTAPMDTVTGKEMAVAVAKWGGIATYPRGKIEESLKVCEEFSDKRIPCIYSVGLKNGFEEAKQLEKHGARVILVDVANGGQQAVKKLAAKIKEKLGLIVMAGNIATYEQAVDYKKYGIDIARVGVGGGGLCTTRIKTGFGVPQIAALMETTAAGIQVIADGGIRYPGDIAKALAIPGVIGVMIGSMIAGTDEAPGEIIVEDGRKKKVVRGQASKEYMESYNIQVTEHRAAEGIATTVDVIGSVDTIFKDILGSLKSSLSYAGAANLSEFKEKAQFIHVSSATQRENLPHILFDRS